MQLFLGNEYRPSCLLGSSRSLVVVVPETKTKKGLSEWLELEGVRGRILFCGPHPWTEHRTGLWMVGGRGRWAGTGF